PACAHADAPRSRPGKRSAVGAISEMGLELRVGVAGMDAEILIGSARMHDLARVHPVLGIPEPFEALERTHQAFAILLRQEHGARLSVAVFTRNRSAVGDDEVRSPFEEAPKRFDAGNALEVEIDAKVHASLAEMAV